MYSMAAVLQICCRAATPFLQTKYACFKTVRTSTGVSAEDAEQVHVHEGACAVHSHVFA